jgi:putative SOS response-associated peptidase YedK
MFESFVLASSVTKIETRFNQVKLPESLYAPAFNIRRGDKTPVIVQGQNHQFKKFRFGLLTEDVEECFIRSEGKKNMTDDPGYSGSKAIFLMQKHRKQIRHLRCLVPADAFYVSNSQGCYYLVFLKNKKRPFAFAGIYSEGTDGEPSFAIVTVPANPLLACLEQKRMPVILHAKDESRWLKEDTPLSRVLKSLNIYPANLMNAYPVDAPPGGINDVSLVKPAGNRVYQEQQEFRLQARTPKKAFSATITFSERRKPT